MSSSRTPKITPKLYFGGPFNAKPIIQMVGWEGPSRRPARTRHGQAPQYLVELCQPVPGVAWHHGNIFDLPANSPGRTASPAQLLWPTGFLCGWSVGLEFPAGQHAESDYWREQFRTICEDVSVSNVLIY